MPPGTRRNGRRRTITRSAPRYRRNWPSGIIPSLGPLKEFFESHRKRTDAQELSQYISFALSCSGPPTFEFAMRDVEIPPDAIGLRELVAAAGGLL